ncbi:hypothetical protein [uncultured Paracoccus sp.]|uniref:hypothetical protein n=1 Tax=uncultured Paracoccus sp. TaxID=189685 RepID=UPI002597E925|nr:hypothetical protein [uncultured Paracoccus sp.]
MSKAKRKRKKLTKQSRAALASSVARGRPVSVAESPWDHGASGQANRVGMVIEKRGDIDPETGRVINPNGITGARRIDLLDYWQKRGTLTARQYNAAVLLRSAFESTQKSPPCLPDNDRVQSSPKPDHAVTIHIERVSRYHAIRRHVHPADYQVIDGCVLGGQHPGQIYGALRARQGFDDLRDALDRMADSLEKSLVKRGKRA